MREPLVSIMIITHNQISFVHETLSSALDQNYKNLEVVVADDGSTDGTVDVILEYAEKYPERLVPLIGRANLGITQNSNRGLRACHGKYVAFMGGDDVLLPGKISAQVIWMEEDKNRVLCGHQVEVCCEDGTSSHLLTSSFLVGSGAECFIKNGCPYAATSIMVRRDSIPEKGFDERLPSVSDYMLWIDCIGNDGMFGYVDGTYARYRRHSGNVTNDAEKCIKDLMLTYTILEKKFPQYLALIQKTAWWNMAVHNANSFLDKGQYLKAVGMVLKIIIFMPNRLFFLIGNKMKIKLGSYGSKI